ncbi:MAG: threonylcarbamoyl-AMP synthase [Bdellovibrionaceae bacterium]|nr:threonylcarbamoyl-AMP synthase [Pseudobdellovibrionaceae bacterium]
MCSEDQAIEILNRGGVVAIPTETVYGLAAQIDKPEALKKIFQTKERPFFDPLIVHVYSAQQAKDYCDEWPPVAQILADNFWPGPLTLVLPKNEKISPLITAGLDTVGLRCPRHEKTLSILRKIQIPLAAPSANKFGKTSPTSAQHVAESLPGIQVLDGGECEVGIESTIVAVKTEPQLQIELLRPGMVPWGEIKKTLKNYTVEYIEGNKEILAPGSLDDHYMPDIPLVLLEQNMSDKTLLDSVNKKLKLHFSSFVNMDLPEENYMAARVLYSRLREAGKCKEDFIVLKVKPFMLEEAWAPLWDRLKKASSLKI